MEEVSAQIQTMEYKIMSDIKQRMLKKGAIEAGTTSKIVRAHLILSNQLTYTPSGSRSLFEELAN
jgi:hypothetical protein